MADLEVQGWLPDVLEQINADREQCVRRPNVLTIDHGPQYLGVTRYAVNKLIK